MASQKNKIQMLENRIDTLENYILTMEDTVKFLKQVIASQNETIKAFATAASVAASTGASTKQQEKAPEQPSNALTYDPQPSKQQETIVSQEKKESLVTKASSMVRRRTAI
jgi:uncharacterized coiled-coil protein SlyX